MCKVLIADDSELMRTAIRKMLQEVSNIDVVGEAANFADTMQKIVVKSLLVTVRTVAVSFSNDSDSKALAESYGAVTLLDKMKLYNEMVPAILHCQSRDSDIGSLLRKPFKRRAHAA
jgi:hypothetical protein